MQQDSSLIAITDAWRAAYPGANAGFLAMRGVINPPSHAALDNLKRGLEIELRARFAHEARTGRAALEVLPAISAYMDYYRKFNKTYHVLGQLESIVFKGKALPAVAALVEAMFMAEIKNLLLTAGHDLDALQTPVRVDVADGSEQYITRYGFSQTLRARDMYMADSAGVISSILYGPDQHTQITPQTRAVLFAVYAPAGINRDLVRAHLDDIRGYAQVIAPKATVEHLAVYAADE